MWQVSALLANLNYSLTYPLLWKWHKKERRGGLKVYVPAHMCQARCLLPLCLPASRILPSVPGLSVQSTRYPDFLNFFFLNNSKELCCVFPFSELGEWYSGFVASTFSVSCGLTDTSIVSVGCGSCWNHLFWFCVKEKRTGRSVYFPSAFSKVFKRYELFFFVLFCFGFFFVLFFSFN